MFVNMNLNGVGPQPIGVDTQSQKVLPEARFEPMPTPPVETSEVDPSSVAGKDREETVCTTIQQGKNHRLPVEKKYGGKSQDTPYNEGAHAPSFQPQCLKIGRNRFTNLSRSSTVVGSGVYIQLDMSEFEDISLDDDEKAANLQERQQRPTLTINTQMGLHPEEQDVSISTEPFSPGSVAFAGRRGYTLPLEGKDRKWDFVDSDADEWEKVTQDDVDDAEWDTNHPSESSKENTTLLKGENMSGDVCTDFARKVLSRHPN